MFDGVLLLRFDTRQFLALLFQLPPRFTRLEPLLTHSLPLHDCLAEALCGGFVDKSEQAAGPHGEFLLGDAAVTLGGGELSELGGKAALAAQV